MLICQLIIRAKLNFLILYQCKKETGRKLICLFL